MSRYIFAVLLLSFFASHTMAAEEENLNQRCVGYLTSSAIQPDFFSIDATTANDVGLDDVVAPVLGKHVITRLGHVQMDWLLRHPLVDPSAIVQRQKAIQYLADEPELRQTIRNLLTVIHRRAADWLPYFSELEHQHRNSSPIPSVIASSASLAILTTYGIASWVVPGVAHLGSLAPVAVMFLAPGTEIQDKIRYRIRVWRSAIEAADKLQPGLEASSSEVLQSIGQIFSATQNRSHPNSLTKIAKPLRSMIPTGVELLTSLTMLGYAPTYYLRKNLVEHKDQLLILMSAIADLDVLCALAESYVENRSNAIFPTILDPNQPTQLSIEGGHHPFIFDKDSKVSVANELDIALSSDPAQSVNQFLLLTGPNTGGKTTYLKMIASLVLMAQIGAPVPARAMAITPLSLLTNMNVRDSLQKGESSFFAQSQRVAQILNVVENQPHVLLIMDEILNGTSPEEHTAIETAVLRHVLGQKYLGILATHDRKLQVLANELPGLANIHVDDKAANTFTVKLGPSVHRNAVQVLVDAGVPAAITAEAERSLKATDPSYPTSRGK